MHERNNGRCKMKQWQSTLCCVVMLVWPGKNARPETSPFTGINTLIHEYIGKSTTIPDKMTQETESPEVGIHGLAEWTHPEDMWTEVSGEVKDMHSTVPTNETPSTEISDTPDDTNGEPPDLYPVQHAGLPLGLAVYPLPLKGSDHELMFNISWHQPMGPPVRGYSLEVHSTTDTVDCRSNMCYEYNIPREALWVTVPTFASPITEGCAVRPGCSYRVKLIAHPWDGHTSANLNVELDECVSGVCSCAHAPRLPVPLVSASTISIHGELYVNVTWSLPSPSEPLRLPPRLRKQYYFVSIGKQMVSDAHPSPWFAHAVSHKVDAAGFVAVPEDTRWIILPIVERSGERDKPPGKQRDIVLDVKLLARVSLIDERGCIGPLGNATAYDPAEAKKTRFETYALWAVLGGACMLVMVAVFAVSARVVKRVLNALRFVPAPAPHTPLSQRPIWFPLRV